MPGRAAGRGDHQCQYRGQEDAAHGVERQQGSDESGAERPYHETRESYEKTYDARDSRRTPTILKAGSRPAGRGSHAPR